MAAGGTVWGTNVWQNSPRSWAEGTWAGDSTAPDPTVSTTATARYRTRYRLGWAFSLALIASLLG